MVLFFAAAVMAMAASHAANAAPGSSRSTLMPARWINGVLYQTGQPNATSMSALSDPDPCAPDDDVYTCAKKVGQAQFQPPQADSTMQKWLKVPLSHGQAPLEYPSAKYFTFGYRTSYSSCSISPVIVSEGDLQRCNGAKSCTYKLSFSTSTTHTENYGFSVGTSVSASGDIGVVSTSVTVSASFNEGWSDSTTNTTTEEVDRTLVEGESCAATSVQLKLTCDARIVSEPYNTAYFYDDSGKQLGWSILCGSSLRGPSIDKICAAMVTGSPVSMDVGVRGLAKHQPWVMKGCMYE